MKFNGLAKLPPPVAYLPSVGLVGFAQSYLSRTVLTALAEKFKRLAELKKLLTIDN